MAEFNGLKEYVRMVKPDEGGDCTIGCDICPLAIRNNGTNNTCHRFIRLHPEKATEIIRKWSEEHPQKTRGDLVLEHFPYANLTLLKPCNFLGEKWKSQNCGQFVCCKECIGKIWNEVAE